MKHTKEHPKAVLDNRSRQLDDTNPAFYRARGDNPEIASLKAEVADLKCKQGVKKG